MKVRNGFVSNSSSSSFIVAVDKDSGPLHLKINIEKDCETITTIEELDKCDRFEYYDEEEKKESKEYQTCVDMINAGKVIKMFSASNDDDYSPLSGFYGCRLTKKHIGKNVTIINDGDC